MNQPNKDVKRILYVTSLNLGVIFWRIESYAEEIVKMKDDCAVMVEYFFDPEDNAAWDKLALEHGKISDEIEQKLNGAFQSFDYIIFQKIQNKEALILIDELKETYPDVKCIAEIDDAIGEVTPSNMHDFKDEHTYAAEHCKRSDAVICSTKYLGDSIRKIVGPDKPIHVVPNCINEDLWQIETNDKPDDGMINIVYVGGGGHDEDLKLVYPAMKRILGERDDVKFTIRSGGFRPDYLAEHERIDFKAIAWHISEYPQKLSDIGADIALAPLRDTEFNRCKSNLKFIEWSYLNVPLVASNVEPFKHTDGDILLFDNNTDDIVEKIYESINTFKPYKENKTLRNSSLHLYNLQKECKRLLTFLNSL